jgi:DNA-binding beta-propeller fold protein YncE
MRSVTLGLFIAAAALTVPAVQAAPTFKVDKVNIGGDGGTDYITAEPGTGRIFISRATHVMVVDAKSGKVLADFPDAPRNHGIALSQKSGHGFITSAGDSSVTMFDLKKLTAIRKIPVSVGGLDGITHDDFRDRIILTNHSMPVGTAVAIDARSGDIVGTAELEDTAPEGAASDGKGLLFVNNERKSTMQVVDSKAMKAVASWPLAPCQGPTGIAMDRKTQRIFAGCSKTSVVVDAKSGKVVATMPAGNGVDALGWDPSQKLIYIPARDGTLTVVHQDGADSYSVLATVRTMPGMKTVAVDPVSHRAYGFVPEYGPDPAPDPNAPPPPAPVPGRPQPPRGPVIAGWLITISH